MGNGFRRIALAQGLLPPVKTSDVSPAWTDAVLATLLQIDEPPASQASGVDVVIVPDPALTARIPATGSNGLTGPGQI